MKKRHNRNNSKTLFSSSLKQAIFYLFVLFAIAGCEKEETITLDPIPEKTVPDNPTDIKIQEILDNYQSKVIYRWDESYIQSSERATPVSFEKVLPYLNFMEDLWINPYETQESGFMRGNMPIEIILVGSFIGSDEAESKGVITGGQASSFTRIMLAGVNYYDLADTFWVNYQVQIFHHEFAHTLEKKYGRPKGYEDISKGKYAGTTSWTEFSKEIARERGFWRNYGMSSESEDFATFVEGFVSTPKEQLVIEVQENDLLKRKYDLVYNYYLDLGIDLHILQTAIEDALNNLTDSQ